MSRAAPPAPSLVCGFSLVEMAVVLAILALLIGGMLMPLSAQQELRHAGETRRLLSEIGEALYGFAASHGTSGGRPYLPCPDTDSDGMENRTVIPGPCVSPEGGLPWATLGLGRQDAWGNPPRYRVAAAFSDSVTGFALTTTGDLRVCADSGCAVVLGSGLPAVVASLGRNGAGSPASADEQENLDGDADFVERPDGAAGFDDLVTWLPPTLLIHRMIATGRLP